MRTHPQTLNVVAWLATLPLIGSLGCSGSPTIKRESAKVSGMVTYQGKPLSGGRIVYMHSAGSSAGADIKDGIYTLTATVGENQISVDYREPAAEIPGGRPGMLVPGKSLVPEKYSAPVSSGLTYTVKSGDQEHDITLQD